MRNEGEEGASQEEKRKEARALTYAINVRVMESLKAYRKASGKTLEEVAGVIGVSTQRFGALELAHEKMKAKEATGAARGVISPGALFMIAQALDRPIAHFFTEAPGSEIRQDAEPLEPGGGEAEREWDKICRETGDVVVKSMQKALEDVSKGERAARALKLVGAILWSVKTELDREKLPKGGMLKSGKLRRREGERRKGG